MYIRVFCPKCRSQKLLEGESWDLKPKSIQIVIRFTSYKCLDCGVEFRDFQEASALSSVAVQK